MVTFLIVRTDANSQNVNHVCAISYTNRSRAEKDCKGYNALNSEPGQIYSVKPVRLSNDD